MVANLAGDIETRPRLARRTTDEQQLKRRRVTSKLLATLERNARARQHRRRLRRRLRAVRAHMRARDGWVAHSSAISTSEMSSTATLSSFASSGTPRLRARLPSRRGRRREGAPARGSREGVPRVDRRLRGLERRPLCRLHPTCLPRAPLGRRRGGRSRRSGRCGRASSYESWSVDNDVDAADFSGSSDPAAAPYAPWRPPNPHPRPSVHVPVPHPHLQRRILLHRHPRRPRRAQSARFFASIPDLPEEERLRRWRISAWR